MNKQKLLTNAIIKQGVICLVILLVFGGLYYFTGTLVDSSAEKKTTADSSLSSDQGQITSLSGQLDKSGVAEKKFMSLQASRDNIDFSNNSDTLKDWLRNAKAEYRLSNSFKLSLTNAKTSDSPEFTGMNYEVVEHPSMKLEFSAMSDAHVFSFLNAFLRNAPGIIRVDSLSLKRTSDIDAGTISQVRAGATPYAVDMKLDFNWIGIKEKAKPETAGAATAGAK